MGKRVLVISTSLRGDSNSDILAKEFLNGGGINDPSEAVKHTDAMTKAYNLGKGL